MFSSLILGLLLAGPAPALAQAEAVPASAQTSNARSAFRSDFDQRVARIRTDLAVHGNVQLQALQDLARDLAVAAEAGEIENLWLELILLAESVADQRGDRELALQWLDPANAQHPVINATGELKPERVALLAQTKQQVAGRPELKARLASWGPAVKLEPLFSFEQAWDRTSQVYGAYEGSISQLRASFEPDSSGSGFYVQESLELFDLRDAPGLYYLVLESLGRDRNWPKISPLQALNHVDGESAEKLVEELLFCGYPEWTRQVLDLWLSGALSMWQLEYRGNLMAALLDDPLGRRAVLPHIQGLISQGQFSAPLVQRLQILMSEDPTVLQAVYGGNYGLSPGGSPKQYYPQIRPLAELAFTSGVPSVRVNSARDLARMPDPSLLWGSLQPDESELQLTFFESILYRDIKPYEGQKVTAAGMQFGSDERPPVDLEQRPELAALATQFVEALSVENLEALFKRLNDDPEDIDIALHVLNSTVGRDDFDLWREQFDDLFRWVLAIEQSTGRNRVPDLRLAEKRYGQGGPEVLEQRDYDRQIEDLVAGGSPEHVAWMAELARRFDYPLELTWVVEDLALAKYDDTEFLKHLMHLARGLSGEVHRAGSLFLQLEGPAGAALRELTFAEGLTPVERLTAWCLGWDPQESPAQFMDLVQRPDMVAAFEEHRANPDQGTTRTNNRGFVEYNLRLDHVQNAIARWYRDSRSCDDAARTAFLQALLQDAFTVDPRTLLLVRWKDDRVIGPELSIAALERLLATPYEDDPTALVCADITGMCLENLRKYAPERLTNELILKLLDDEFTVQSTIAELQQMPTRIEWLEPLTDLIREDSIIGRMPYTNDSVRDRSRVAVVQLLERLNSLEAAQVLLEFDQFQNTVLSKEVNAALSRMRERFATREAFANWNNQQRQRAQTIAGLAALLDAKEPDQRVAAVQSLGALAAQEYLPDLILLFADEDPSVAAAARKAVRSIQNALDRELGSSAEDRQGDSPEGESQ